MRNILGTTKNKAMTKNEQNTDNDNEIFILSQDGKEIFRGTEFKCYLKLQSSQGQSAQWAMKYSGWKIEPLINNN